MVLRLRLFERVMNGDAGTLIWTFAQSADPYLQAPTGWLEKEHRLFNASAAGQWELLKGIAGLEFSVEAAATRWTLRDFITAMRERAQAPRLRVLSDARFQDHMSLGEFNFECWLLGDVFNSHWD